jgi:hypothetical protein
LLLLLLLPVVLLLPLAFDLRGGANGQQFSGQFSTTSRLGPINERPFELKNLEWFDSFIGI